MRCSSSASLASWFAAGPLMGRASFDRLQEAIAAEAGEKRPRPEDRSSVVERDDDKLRRADEIVVRHKAHHRRHTAIGGIIAIVPHHEVMAGRHFIDARVVEFSRTLVEGDIADPVRQRLTIGLNLFDDAVFVFERLHAQRFTLHRFAIYMQQAVDHLDTIARHANDALDEVAIRLRLRAEYDHVATLWLAAEEAAMRQQPFKR